MDEMRLRRAFDRQLHWMQLLYTSKTAEQRRQSVLLTKEARDRAGEIRTWAETATLEEQRHMVLALWGWRKMARWRMPTLPQVLYFGATQSYIPAGIFPPSFPTPEDGP